MSKISKVAANNICKDKLKKDLDKYIQFAQNKGASDCKILNKNDFILDIRARLKCMYPKCEHYGTNIHCPPYTPDLDVVKKMVDAYSYGILISLKIPSERLVGELATQKEKSLDRRKLSEIITSIESQAFYDGYYFATGFSGGSCKFTWCINSPCQALEEGKGCRFPLKSRPSMEAMGFDVYKMVANAGWDIYPIGKDCNPSEIPYGRRVGLVLIC